MISKILGRKPLVDSYPNLIEKAVEFIKLNGYSAHARRHNSIASSGAGVSVDAVQQHLIKTIQCLTDISKTAVSYLFCPPTKSQKSNERYKGFKQGFLQNEIIRKRKTLILTIYLFSRVKMRR